MGNKWIYIIIGVLALVLIYLLVKGGQGGSGGRGFLGTSNPVDGTSSAYTGGSNVGALLSEISQNIQPQATEENCSKDCRQLCSVYPPTILCKDRCMCKKECKSSCVKGLDYKSMFP